MGESCRARWELVLSVLLGWEKWLWPPYQLRSCKASPHLQMNLLQLLNLGWQIWDEARVEETRQQGWEGKHQSDPNCMALQGSPGFAWDWLGLLCLCPPLGGGGELHSLLLLKVLFLFPCSVVIMQFSPRERVFMEHRRKQHILERFMGLENRLTGFFLVL